MAVTLNSSRYNGVYQSVCSLQCSFLLQQHFQFIVHLSVLQVNNASNCKDVS